jgi:hypothetical protein
MAGQFEPGMDAGALSAMGFGKSRPQPVLVARRHDEVNRVRQAGDNDARKSGHQWSFLG